MPEIQTVLEKIQTHNFPIFIEAFRLDENTLQLSSTEQFLQAAAGGAGRLVAAIYAPYVPVHFHDSPRKTHGNLLPVEKEELKKDSGYHIWASPDGSGFELVSVAETGDVITNLLSWQGNLAIPENNEVHFTSPIG